MAGTRADETFKGDTGMKCYAVGCENEAIGYEDNKKVRNHRCREHEVKHQKWKQKRLFQAIKDKKIIDIANEKGEEYVGLPDILKATGDKAVDVINKKLKEIYG